MKRQRRLRQLSRKRKPPLVINVILRDMSPAACTTPAEPPKAKEPTAVGDQALQCGHAVVAAAEGSQVCSACRRGSV
jgi:hypothetical protein